MPRTLAFTQTNRLMAGLVCVSKNHRQINLGSIFSGNRLRFEST